MALGSSEGALIGLVWKKQHFKNHMNNLKNNSWYYSAPANNGWGLGSSAEITLLRHFQILPLLLLRTVLKASSLAGQQRRTH